MNSKKWFIIKTIIISTFITFSTFAQNFSPPDWCYDKTIYEVNVRQYTEEGNFASFEKHLPRLKELGVGILWFMPVHPIGKINRKGTLGSYYSVKDYKDINPEFGTLKDFKSLVDKIHSMGMYVIIDWVANHTAWDNDWTRDHPDFYTKDSLENIISPNTDWIDVADLNYDNRDLWKEMISALKFWVEDYDIDGYRCDVAGMLPIEFWIEARTELEKIKNVFMLAEWDTPEMHRAFDMSYDWNLHKTMNRIAVGENSVSNLINHIISDQNKYPDDAIRMQFTSNHDENTWNGTVFERLGDAAETFAALSYLIPDMPLIYSGQEVGLNIRLDFFEKDLIEWKDHKFSKLYKKLNQLKKENKALLNGSRGGKMNFFTTSNPETVFAFAREKEENQIVCIFNLSKENISTKLTSVEINGTYKNYFTGESITISQKQDFELSPWEYKIFIK